MKNYFKKFLNKGKRLTSLECISGDYHNFISSNPYRNNVIVHKCVSLIAQSAGHVPWVVLKKKGKHFEKIYDHPLISLLKRPNPQQGGADFFVETISNKLLFGNSYILGIGKNNNIPAELYNLHPENIQIAHKNGQIHSYVYNNLDKKLVYHVNPITKETRVLHLKNYNPNSQIYGLSALEGASMAIDLHNKASQWNISLLKNGARPSGALVVNNAYLSEEQFHRLKEQLHDNYIGSSNSGKPLLLEGGLDWKEMSFKPKDMDFIESKNIAAKEIALAFRVPPYLLGITGDNTYSNMKEARLALWEETIIPLLDQISDALTNWINSWGNNEVIIDFDRDNISVLTERRQNLWEKLSNANFMTINEKRAFIGMPHHSNGDKL